VGLDVGVDIVEIDIVEIGIGIVEVV